MAKLTNRLLKKACKISKQYAEMQAILLEAFEDRYGVTYSEVDCDPIIDILDGVGGVPVITVAECDEHMLYYSGVPVK